MTSQTNLKGHVAKSIAPSRMFGIEHTSPTQNIVIIDVETINSLIQEELLSLYIQLCHAQGYLSTAF